MALKQGVDDHSRIIDHQYSGVFTDDNLPLFYFSILPSNYPDTIYKIRPKSTNQRAISFLRQGTKWEDLQKYLLLEKNLSRSENQSLQSLIWLINQSNDLHEIKPATQHVSDSLRNYPDFQSWVGQLDRCIAGSNKLLLSWSRLVCCRQ